MNTVGKRIASKREKCGLSQEDLAELLSTTPAQVNFWEMDEGEPDPAMIEKIAAALKVMPEFLKGIWSEDLYEDFEGANDEIKLRIFKDWGVPPDLQHEYRVLCGDKADKSKKPTAEELYTIKLLRLTEPGDKDAIRSILKKYEKSEKKSADAG